jgi:hypothetical protein
VEFATLVAADLPPSLARDALRVTRAVFGLLEKELDRGETDKIIATLPHPLRVLWPGPISQESRRSDGILEKTMRIDATEFGAVTIDAKTYEHDVIIRLSGKVEKRRKRLSKEKYGTSHIVSKEEAKFVFEGGCEVLIVGAGQDGNVRLSPEASAYLDKKRCRVILQPTPEAIVSFNRSRDKKIALIHVTC